ncbi:MAG: arylsulfatase, partial [Verrucomicrobia bacterium]|nr:arylsulfatase [Verrucomicrobiota bacterium]
AHWPAGIKARAELRAQPGHLVDILPTCLEVAGATPLKERVGTAVLPPEGRSLVPAFANQPLQREALYWEHEGNAAIRVGDLKLVRAGRNGAWELYDLKKDRTEQQDLAGAQPDKVKELAAQWEAWAVRANVKPYPEAGGKKKKGK